MPMKAMVYKTLSTVVDDFFAYVDRHCSSCKSSWPPGTGSASRCRSYIALRASGKTDFGREFPVAVS